jgi:predicted transposase YbfD/YdcC
LESPCVGSAGLFSIQQKKTKMYLYLVSWNLPPNQEPEEVHMQDITLGPFDDSGFVFDIGALNDFLKRLTDTRGAQGKIYPLSRILSWVLLARLCGENTPHGIFEWVRLRQETLVRLFACKHHRTPCLNTYRTVLGQVVSQEELQAIFNRFLLAQYGGQRSVLVVIDGKTMRGTIPAGATSGVHLLAAYLPEEGVVLAQVAVEAKHNEIVAAPILLEQVDLKNRVVCGDAMHTQRELSVQIMAAGGDYLWFLKDNQPTTLADVQQFFVAPRVAPGWHSPKLPRQMAKAVQKGHGRIEKRCLTSIVDEQGFLDWPGVQQVFMLERQVTDVNSSQTRHETVYGLTSCSPAKADAEQLLCWTQAYWGIENGLHYRRDVTLGEDGTRITNQRFAEMLSIMNNFVISLTQKLRLANLASARRQFDAQTSELLARAHDY